MLLWACETSCDYVNKLGAFFRLYSTLKGLEGVTLELFELVGALA